MKATVEGLPFKIYSNVWCKYALQLYIQANIETALNW